MLLEIIIHEKSEERKIRDMKKTLKEQRNNEKGFTLVEMIVVIGIIGILVAMIAPSLVGYINKAKVSNNRVAATTIGRAAASLYAEDPTFLKQGELKKSGLEDLLEGLKGAYVVWVDDASQQIKAMYAPNTEDLPSSVEGWTGHSTERLGMYPEDTTSSDQVGESGDSDNEQEE